MLEAEALNLAEGDAAALASSTAALIGYCFGAKANDAVQMRAAIGSSLFALVRQNIDKALGDPRLDVDYLAREHGISRSSLYRMFEPFGGVNAFIRHRRLSRIYRDLSSPENWNQRISSIAFRWGFTSEVTFSKAFKAAFDISARDSKFAGSPEGSLARPGRHGAQRIPTPA